jgi:GT2 family glycosyltransferase
LHLTAIVVTWNSAEEVPALIESFERHLAPGAELLFVDNASSDGTTEVIRSLAPRSELIELEDNIGFGPANNLGVRATKSDVVALLNPDTIVVDDSLEDLAAVAARERGLFAPRLLHEDGSIQISARPALASLESALISVWPGALMPRRLRARCEPWRYDERLPAGWISAACLVARRDLLLEFGPFDERLVLYGEDADLSLRAWQQGVPSISAPDVARLVHLGGRSAAQVFDDNGMRRKVEVRWWIVNEHFGPVRAWLDLALQLVQFGSRWLARRLLGRDARNEAAWLRGARRAIRPGNPRTPAPLPERRPEAGATGSRATTERVR